MCHTDGVYKIMMGVSQDVVCFKMRQTCSIAVNYVFQKLEGYVAILESSRDASCFQSARMLLLSRESN